MEFILISFDSSEETNPSSHDKCKHMYFQNLVDNLRWIISMSFMDFINEKN